MEVAALFASLGLKVKEREWAKGDSLIKGAKAALAAFASVKVVGKLAESIESVLKFTGDLNDLSQKTGLATGALQEYGYAATLAGSSMSGVAEASKFLSKNLIEATKGSGPASEAFRELKISSQAIKQSLKSEGGLDMMLMELADRFSKLEDGPKKTALALAILGKSGTELIPFLNEGREGLSRLRQEANDLGIVISKDNIIRGDEVGDELDKVKMSLQGLKNQAIVAILPAIKDLITITLQWIKSNRSFIQTNIANVVKGFTAAVKVAMVAIKGISVILEWLNNHSRVATALLITLGSILVAVAIKAAAAWVIAQAPLLLFIAGVTLLILALWDLWESIAMGEGVFAEIWRSAARSIEWYFKLLKRTFSQIKDFFLGIARSIKDFFQSVIDAIVSKLNWVKNKVMDVKNFVTSLPGKAWDTITSIPDTIFGDDSPSAPSLPPVVYTDSNRGSQTNNNVAIVNNVTSNNADPAQVAKEVSNQFETKWNSKMRNAHADSGE